MSLTFNALPGQTWETQQGSSYASLYARKSSNDAIQRTQQPIMTSTSVLGIKYDGGVLLAADCLASYGSLARFDDVTRLHQAGKFCCLGAGGDLSDFQNLQHLIDQKLQGEDLEGDGPGLSPSEVFQWLSQVMYARRNKMDPLWNSIVVGGFENNESFLAYVDLQGTTYTSPSIATGYGAPIAQPLLRKVLDDNNGSISREVAEQAILQSMQVLFYRDARSINKFQIADINKDGVTISKPRSVPTSWGFAEGLRGYGAQEQ